VARRLPRLLGVRRQADSPGWCGGIQITFRDAGIAKGSHHAWLMNSGESVTFGSNGQLSAEATESIPRALGSAATVPVRVTAS